MKLKNFSVCKNSPKCSCWKFYKPRVFQVEELKETVKEEFMPWVSQYLVMKRVSIEPNFHSLYSNFLDTLKNPEFVKMVLNETYRNIKVKH